MLCILFLSSSYLAVLTFDQHPGIADRLHIRIGGCLHFGHNNTKDCDVFNLMWYTNTPMNTVSPNELAAHRVLHLEAIV